MYTNINYMDRSRLSQNDSRPGSEDITYLLCHAKVHYRAHNSRHWTQSWASWTRPTPNILLIKDRRLRPFPSGFQVNTLNAFLFCSTHATCPAHFIFLDFILIIFYGVYEGVSKSFRAEPITKYTLTTINTRWEATQRVMVAKLTGLTHKIAIQLHLVAESCTICGSRAKRPVRKLLDTPSYEAPHYAVFFSFPSLLPLRS
jgi:hypothetical protein